MLTLRPLLLASSTLVVCGALACSSKTTGSASSSATSPSGSEVAVSVVSGALNNNSGSSVAWAPRGPRRSTVGRVLDFMNPIGTAEAATWSCSGETLTPAFRGPAGDLYAFTPPTCKVTWTDGVSATSSWNGPFSLDYGSSCDAIHPFMENQAAGCVLTRTSDSSGDTRTITGPDGNDYAIDHDTNGGGTGWDSSVSPAPTNAGVLLTCGSSGCADGGTLVVSGSHLTGTVTIDDLSVKIWDHTVTTDPSLTVTGSAGNRVVSGTVMVQHNLLKYTSTTTFASVSYGDSSCCFPTTGSVSTTFSKGADVGKTEKLTFSSACGETTLTAADGTTAPLTLIECL